MLPPLDEFLPYLQALWENKVLTNQGMFHQNLEVALKEFLGVPELSLFNNGTIALLCAFEALNLTGEVITTPYSFIATAHSLLWQRLKPVFVDIDPGTLNMDPNRIEAAITERTSAILPVHCYGYPCDYQKIQAIANKYQLKVIYDAAHAFAVTDEQGSILNQGDLSVLSFHATKVFHTFEGGAIISKTPKMKQTIDRLKNFGIDDEVTVSSLGINGKMSEVNAAMGLLQLKHLATTLAARKSVDEYYRRDLKELPGIYLLERSPLIYANYAYFPILVNDSLPSARDALYDDLKTYGIYARRYFYPLISNFPMYQSIASAAVKNLPVANAIADRILCLPIYPGLTKNEQQRIIERIKKWSHMFSISKQRVSV
ncbi:MAG: DegT/DnrJ/EryC1/StrS family aminotransferase [Legionella sp.]|nr:DegT/DnrJ/EryC1/StrS family aminotransferase [Legionella sp.]